MKKKAKISFEDKKELELLNKYYNVDYDNKIVTMPLHYEKASDLIDSTVISKDNYLFDYSELTMINDRITRIPKLYSVNINIQIDDYEDYEPNKLISGFNDALELNSFNFARERRKKWLYAAILLMVGISILFFVAYGKLNSWFGEGNRGQVFGEVFDIIGWVFIWEMVTISFLTPSELGVNSIMFKTRVKLVSFLDAEDNILASEKTDVIYSRWQNDKALSIASRWALLISGITIILLGIIQAIEAVGTIDSTIAATQSSADGVLFGILVAVFTILETVTLIIAGILNLLLYMRKIRFKIASYIFSGLLFLFLIFNILMIVLSNGAFVTTSNIVTIIMIVLYIFGAVFTLVTAKKSQK